MKCQDTQCSCQNLETNVLYEIHGGFCVESRTTHPNTNHLKVSNEPSNKEQTEIIIVAILGAILILGLLSIGLYMISFSRKDIDFCAR